MLDTATTHDADVNLRPIQRAGSTCPADPSPAVVRPNGGISSITIRWFVARVNTGGRDVRRVQNELADRGYETFNPCYIDRSDRAKGAVIRPLFVGYLPFGCESGLWGEAKRAPGVVAILADSMTRVATQVPEIEMARLFAMCPGGVHDPDPPRAPIKRFVSGARVRVEDAASPLAGLEGVVKLDEAERIKVLMDILGGAVVELRRGQLAEVG